MTTLPFSALEAHFLDLMQRHGVKMEEACHLYGHDFADEMSTCYPCAQTLRDAAHAHGQTAVGIEPVEDGEGPRYCAVCGVYICEGFTEASIDEVLAGLANEHLTPTDLPELVEGMRFYGDLTPERCAACPIFVPLHPAWQAPPIDIDTARWFETANRPVEFPCPGCLTPRVLPARVARVKVERVQRWMAFRALVHRAYQELVVPQEEKTL